MRRDHSLAFVAAALSAATAVRVALVSAGTQPPHEPVRLVKGAQQDGVAQARLAGEVQSSSPTEAAARKAETKEKPE